MGAAMNGQLLRDAREALALDSDELARLFGVSSETVEQWFESGVPSDQVPKADVLANIVELLKAKIKAERIPAVVRRHTDAYDGLTLLEMIERDRHEDALDSLQRSFDWDTACS